MNWIKVIKSGLPLLKRYTIHHSDTTINSTSNSNPFLSEKFSFNNYPIHNSNLKNNQKKHSTSLPKSDKNLGVFKELDVPALLPTSALVSHQVSTSSLALLSNVTSFVSNTTANTQLAESIIKSSDKDFFNRLKGSNKTINCLDAPTCDPTSCLSPVKKPVIHG